MLPIFVSAQVSYTAETRCCQILAGTLLKYGDSDTPRKELIARRKKDEMQAAAKLFQEFLGSSVG